MRDVFVLLGASDPEMSAIEKLAREAGIPYGFAVGSDGKRCHPGNAYKAAGYIRPSGFIVYPCNSISRALVTVECGWEESRVPDVIIDHHRLGDRGYGCPPEEFLEASSIGQFVAFLARQGKLPWRDGFDCPGYLKPGDIYFDHGRWSVVGPSWLTEKLVAWDIPMELVLAAAVDHCLEAAYRGRCPGVDPDALMRWRVEQRAAFQGRSVESVLADVEAARAKLRYAAAMETGTGIGWDEVNNRVWLPDLRGKNIPELPEAAAREGIPFLADRVGRDGRRRVVLMAAPPDMVREFLAGKLVPGLVDYYGDPARGFAGGYLSKEEKR